MFDKQQMLVQEQFNFEYTRAKRFLKFKSNLGTVSKQMPTALQQRGYRWRVRIKLSFKAFEVTKSDTETYNFRTW